MRQLVCLLVVIGCCAWAAAQSDRAFPGTYAEPFAPRLATPSAPPEALATPSLILNTPRLSVGAGMGTWSATSSPVYVNQPLWYAPGVRFNPAITTPSLSAAPTASGYGIELGAAMFQSSYGVAQLAGTSPGTKAKAKAKRVYTNQDVASVNDSNGLIKFRGKLDRAN